MNEQQFDKFLNIETTGFQYGFPKLAKYHRYEPTPYSGLEQLFEVYALPPGANFLDIGCGKGRVPIYVHHRFDIPAIGIEMDPKFFIEAEHNAAQYLKKAGKKRSSLQFYNMVAETYQIQGKDQVFFFFNPFSIHVFREFMSKILKSYEQYTRTIDIVLYYPSPDYLHYLHQDLGLDYYLNIKLRNEKNENERIIIFRLQP
ncbi:class I SAM-dependent methyltransferase [Solibacillus daqui]|uniref:class I SAM-dependent methyltransferase n=1 Tax=Solibacillus daqui TaxID=2912187 RepID=UPI0023659524|nr:class I SAM-dependent methyltransferase [Solibacillus daqui]